MPNLRTLALRSSVLYILLVGSFATPQHSLAQQQRDATPTLTVNARTVIVDVVVTGKNGKPVKDLHQQDFSISEDGQPQHITSFEEHPGPHPPAAPPPLPPNVFTNIPRATPAGSPIVLLLDSLNTPLTDQTNVRKQMLSYLQHLKPGIPIAIVTLGSQLRFIQGFTDDPSILRAVVQNIHSGAAPVASDLLQSKTEATATANAAAQIASGPGGGQMAAALQGFLAEQTSSQDSSRALITLDALQQLAHYLAGIPGRKSIIWFSGAFPSYIFPDQSLTNPSSVERGFADQIRIADALLATAQVAIYPIAAEGLINNSLYDVGSQLTGQDAYTIQQQSNTSLQNDALLRNADHTTMDQIAAETGGKAFYNNNGIDAAIARVAQHAANYYTLSYTPSQTRSPDHFRKIKVHVAGDHLTLAYRNGYFTTNPSPAKALKPNIDPLLAFMTPQIPDSTEIPLALLIQPPPSPLAASPTPACPSDNHTINTPLPCYTAVFVIAASGLQFTTAPDGSRHDTIEVTLLTYSDSGKILNWIVRQVNLDMDPARFAQVQSIGVHLSLSLGVPKAGTDLRGGVYDFHSGRAGTLTLPLASIVTANQPRTPSLPAGQSIQ